LALEYTSTPVISRG